LGEKEYGPVDDADAEEEAGGAERGHAPRGHARRRSLVRPQRRRSHHRGWPPRMPSRSKGRRGKAPQVARSA